MMIEAAREALFAAGIGGETLAGRLLLAAAGDALAASGVFEAVRYELCALLQASESGLRYAIKTLAAAGLVECLAAPRRAGRVRLAVKVGLRVARIDERPVQQQFGFAEEPEARSQEPGEGTAKHANDAKANVSCTFAPCVVPPADAVAQRESAALRREADEAEQTARRNAAVEGGIRGAAGRVSKVWQASDLESLRARWPSLMEAANGDTLARGVHSYSQIPPFPAPLVKQEIPIPEEPGARSQNPAVDSPRVSPPDPGGSVEKRARKGLPHPQGGKIAAYVRKIFARVKIDPRYEWIAYSAALLAVEGPLSEHTLAGCIEGCRGDGGKFVSALKSHLAECDRGRLRQLTLWDERAGVVQLHRFTHLRPTLSFHGIQLPDRATGLVRTAQRTARRA